MISPALPAAAFPVEIFKCPEAPLLTVPVEKDNAPLAPKVPASSVLITTEPLDLTVP